MHEKEELRIRIADLSNRLEEAKSRLKEIRDMEAIERSGCKVGDFIAVGEWQFKISNIEAAPWEGDVWLFGNKVLEGGTISSNERRIYLSTDGKVTL